MPPPDPRRRFIYAPEMDKLRDRIAEAEEKSERALEDAMEMVDRIDDGADLLERICYLVLAIRDFRSHLIQHDELYARARMALDGIRESIPPEIMAELGPAFSRPIS